MVAFLRQGGHHEDTMDQKRKAASRRPCHNALISQRKFGAGEGIRTLDPNLGKVATCWRLTC
jgi:hypothetical protein